MTNSGPHEPVPYSHTRLEWLEETTKTSVRIDWLSCTNTSQFRSDHQKISCLHRHA